MWGPSVFPVVLLPETDEHDFLETRCSTWRHSGEGALRWPPLYRMSWLPHGTGRNYLAAAEAPSLPFAAVAPPLGGVRGLSSMLN